MAPRESSGDGMKEPTSENGGESAEMRRVVTADQHVDTRILATISQNGQIE